MPADPALQVADRCSRFGQPEVSPPALHIAVPVFTQLVTAATSPRIPDLANPSFESLHTLQCYSDPLLAVQSKAQELSFPYPPCSALSGIHLQSQMLPNPILERGQRAFRRRLTAHLDVVFIAVPPLPILT